MIRVQLKLNNIKTGVKYSSAALAKEINISRKTLSTNLDQIIELIKECWQFEISYTKTGQPRFLFTKQISEYVYKKGRDIICESGCTCLEQQPINTPTNVGRILNSSRFPAVQELGYKDNTVTTYWRIDSKKYYGTQKHDYGSFDDVEDMRRRRGYIDGYIWCKLDKDKNEYIPLTQEQKDYFIRIRKEYDKETDEELDNLISEYKRKEITKKEYLKAITDIYGDENGKYSKIANLIAAKQEFNAKYGFSPCLAKRYVTYSRAEQSGAAAATT